MRRRLIALALGATVSVAATAAQALPATANDGAQAAPKVILVAGGCGLGFHRGPYGGCRPNLGRFYGHPGWRRGWGYGYGWHRWHRW